MNEEHELMVVAKILLTHRVELEYPGLLRQYLLVLMDREDLLLKHNSQEFRECQF
jgi:hypothetical protein